MADQAEIQQLIRQLRNFRTRRDARYRLVGFGAEAVEALIAAVSDRDEGVAWSSIQSLAEIGDARAVGPLIESMGRGRLVFETADALRDITGKDFGDDVERWNEWARAEGVGTAAAAAGGPAEAEAVPADTQALLERVVAGTDMTVEARGDAYRVTVPLSGGRSQSVSVMFSQEDAEGDDLVVVYTECGPADSKYYEAVLRRNLKVPHGAYGIRDIKGEPTFVMSDTLLRKSISIDELRKSVTSVARRADVVEKALTGEDKR